jgi:hypothetical protein
MTKEANYQEFSVLPENWTRAQWAGQPGNGNVINDADPFKWSGKSDPPAIGAKVKLYMNDFGTGTVTSYFAEYGWLGILVKLDNPPAWYVKQNEGKVPKAAHFFGIDLEPRTAA